MDVHFFYPDGKQMEFRQLNTKSYRGNLLIGSQVQQCLTSVASIIVQEYRHQYLQISYRVLELFTKIRFSVNEPKALRLEALLSGEMHVSVNGSKRKFRAGEYRITDVPLFRALFRKGTSCNIFISYYSTEFLEQIGIAVEPCAPRLMPSQMMKLIDEMFRNPYTETLRNFYYENSVRELLFFHLTQGKKGFAGRLMDANLSIIYEADALMASDLRQHRTIEEIAKLLNSNSLKLKNGFRKVFDMGVFERLVYRRMEYAKILLETTNSRIEEIGLLAGYTTTAGFIHAFRKRFGRTPREWRKQELNSDSDADVTDVNE